MEALKSINNEFELDFIESQENKKNETSKGQGIICNSGAHWFAIRKINGRWYNLNS